MQIEKRVFIGNVAVVRTRIAYQKSEYLKKKYLIITNAGNVFFLNGAKIGVKNAGKKNRANCLMSPALLCHNSPSKFCDLKQKKVGKRVANGYVFIMLIDRSIL